MSLDAAVKRLADAATEYLTNSSQDGDAEALKGPLAAIQEAASDLAGELDDPSSSPLFAGWLPDHYIGQEDPA